MTLLQWCIYFLSNNHLEHSLCLLPSTRWFMFQPNINVPSNIISENKFKFMGDLTEACSIMT
jgi:hypothetical protein